jgi:RimJ/RimL family protein N-acetyltransferase
LGGVERSAPILRTDRLILRPWRPEDLAPFADLNADFRVTATLAGALDRTASDALAGRIVAAFASFGYAQWAVEVPGVAPFIGFIGLSRPNFEAHFTPAVEVGWRLAFDHWGKGYATEGARAALDFAFTHAGLDAVVSFTASSNAWSRAVMARIGMHHDPRDDFIHPKLAADHPLKQHVLYRLTLAEWREKGGRS